MTQILVYFALGFLIDLALTSIISFSSAIFALRQQLKDLGLSFSEVLGKMFTGQAQVSVNHKSSEKPTTSECIIASTIQFLSFGIASFIYFHQLPNTNLASSILLGTVWGSIYAALQLIAMLINNCLDKAIAKDRARNNDAPKDQPPVTSENDSDEDTPRGISPWDICDVVIFFATPVVIYLIFFLI